MRLTWLWCGLLALSVGSFGQTTRAPKLPCDYSGHLLRTANGRLVRYTSDEMKARAVRKVDISDAAKQWDISGTALIDVLVGPKGDVVCMKVLMGHPLVAGAVADALRYWTFTVAKVEGKPVAYLGRMQFALCNIMCGEQGPSMTILK